MKNILIVQCLITFMQSSYLKILVVAIRVDLAVYGPVGFPRSLLPVAERSGFPLKAPVRCYHVHDRIACSNHTIIPLLPKYSLGAFLNSTNPIPSLFCQHGFLQSCSPLPVRCKWLANYPAFPPCQLKAGYSVHSLVPHSRFFPVQ